MPHYSALLYQVGAGTMIPNTFLRVLGPEPWNVAYVEPSVRPDDGRYGENPNRFQLHTQYQVILKPDPGNPQGTLPRVALCARIDPRQHDIRFVEDNWNSPPSLPGVWLGGLGSTARRSRSSLLQQMGGVTLDPISVELTYDSNASYRAQQRQSHLDEEWARV